MLTFNQLIMVFLKINFPHDQSALYSSNINYSFQLDVRQALKFHGNNQCGSAEDPRTTSIYSVELI